MLNFDPQHMLGTVIFSAFVLVILYRRFRRNFGRQKMNREYLIFRMVLLCVVAALLLIPSFFSRELAWLAIGGAAAGVSLALWAARHTKFLKQDGVLYYIPHTYTGMVVSALFIGRIAYRIVTASQPNFSMMTMGSEPGLSDFGGLSNLLNPITYGLFFILIGYYVYYYWYVLHESKHLKDSDMEDGVAVPAKPRSGPGGNLS